MNLRDHVEVTLLLARLALPAPPDDVGNSGSSAESASRFWHHARYLEFLWSKEQQRGRFLEPRGWDHLAIEVLTTGLLLEVAAAAMTRRVQEAPDGGFDEHWRLHCNWRVEFLQHQGKLRPASQLRIDKLQRRLGHWSELLLGSVPRVTPAAAELQRPEERLPDRAICHESVWPLVHRGLMQAIPAVSVTDLLRVPIHRLLQELALQLVPAEAFLSDGRLKPRSMRMIEAGWRGAS